MSLILVFTLATLRRYIKVVILSKRHYVFLSLYASIMSGRTLYVGSSHLVPVEMVWPPQVFTLSWVRKTSPATRLGCRPASRYPGCKGWKNCCRDDTPVPSGQQEFGNMACSTSVSTNKSHHSPGRKWPGDSHWRVPQGLSRVTEKMSHLDCWPPSATGKGKKNRHWPHHTTGSLAPVHTRCLRLHSATPFSSDNHQLWRRYQHHQPAPGRWNTTSEADPASWHGQEEASMPRQHPSEPSWHRHSDHGYPIGVYLNSSKLFSRLFSEPPLWQEIIQWLAIIKFAVPFSQSHDVNIYTCYSYVQVYKDQQCTPEPVVTRWSKSLVSMYIHSVWMIYTCYEFIHIWKETSNTPQSQT